MFLKISATVGYISSYFLDPKPIFAFSKSQISCSHMVSTLFLLS